MNFSTVTGNNDVTVLKSDAGVPPGNEVDVTAVTGAPDEFARESETVSLGDTTCSTDVPPRTVVVAITHRFASQFL